METRVRRLVLLSWLGLSACSAGSGTTSGTGETSPTSGGATSSGGALTSGGALSSGGSVTSGGALSSGGSVASGGALNSGGSVASGGALSSGGAVSSGGNAGSSGGAAAGAGAGNTGGGGSSGGGSTGGPCTAPGITFCSDFEADTLPSALLYYPEYQRPMMSNWITISSTVAHSGTRSVKVDGNQFSQMLGVTTPGATFWGRVYLRSETDIQEGHNTYVAATNGTGDPNDAEYVRIGEHQCQLEVNRKTDDKEKLSNGGTYMCSGGTKFLANTWYCLEFFYDGPNSALQVFVDRDEITNLKVTD
jgi:hypothetical protein